jgi:thiamine biosynthesis protein ThiS
MGTETINIVINGEPREIPANQCVAALLDWLSISSDRVAVELNKSIVRKRDWAEAQIGNGARIEIVEFVGGG